MVERGWDDSLFLAANSLTETVFLMYVMAFLAHAPHVDRSLQSLHPARCLLSVLLLLVLDDAFYAPWHRALHTPMLYPIHRHHHKVVFPSRGYADAANEHPLEQAPALALHYAAIRAVCLALPTHALAVVLHILLKAVGACLNHGDADVAFLSYSTRAHETHHRAPTSNFCQNIMVVDRLMGTYREYAA